MNELKDKWIFSACGDFPDNTATAIRLSLLARGLVHNGYSVDIHILNPWYDMVNDKKYPGLRYLQLGLKKRKLYSLVSPLVSMYKSMLLTYKDRNKLHSVFIAKGPFYFFLPYLIFCKFLGLKIVTEVDEGLFYNDERLYQKINNVFFRNFLFLFNTVFVITENLTKEVMHRNKNVVLLGNVVDIDFFDKPDCKFKIDYQYLCYAGSFLESQNGVMTILKSFHRLKKKKINLKLVFVGRTGALDYDDLIQYVNKFELSDSVIFTGLIEREEVACWMKNSILLVLAKPKNYQNNNNFPIKLGEYLSTGVPCLITDAVQSSDWLIDRLNCFISTYESYAEVLEDIVMNKLPCENIGLAGKEVAKKFNYISVSKILLNE